MTEGVAVAPASESIVVTQQDNIRTTEDLASMFKAELEAERNPPKAEAPAPETPAEPAPVEAAETAETESEAAEPADDTATAEQDESGAETPTEEAPAIAAPSGMTEADKAVYAKLPTELKAWVAKQEAARTADYTRKSQAIAEQKKQFDSALPALVQRLNAFDEMLAKVTDNEIAPPDPALRNTDPLAYDEALANYMHASHQKEVAAKERQKIANERQALERASFQQFAQAREAELREKAPEFFGPKGNEIGKQIQEYAAKVGYTPEQLRHAKADDLITLWKAQRFDAIEAAKKNVKSVPPPAAPVMKPGPAKGVGRPNRVAAAVQTLSQNPSRAALAAAFAAELASERR